MKAPIKDAPHTSALKDSPANTFSPQYIRSRIGKVCVAIVGSTAQEMVEKAMEAVRNWKFEPAMKDGHPVRVEIAVEVDFHLY